MNSTHLPSDLAEARDRSQTDQATARLLDTHLENANARLPPPHPDWSGL